MQATDIPVVQRQEDALCVRVMAGQSYGAVGPIKMRNPGMLLDVRLDSGGRFEQPVSSDWNGFAYVYEGSGQLCGTRGSREQVQ
jgi:quercetin 2,3-dioxygenase